MPLIVHALMRGKTVFSPSLKTRGIVFIPLVKHTRRMVETDNHVYTTRGSTYLPYLYRPVKLPSAPYTGSVSHRRAGPHTVCLPYPVWC
jgi:hypothetical protein